MSTIKSSAENLTLNADGANNDIIFQSNGSNVATLDQAGLFTATSYAGSGANLTNLPSTSTADILTAATIQKTNTQNLGLGVDAVNSITSGDYNVGIGNGTLTSVTSGEGNTGVGRRALELTVSGNYNTAVGMGACTVTTGSDNTGMGVSALGSNTSGAGNTGIGRASLALNTTASNNTAVGYLSLYANQTGVDNTAVGYGALPTNLTSGNTAVGKQSQRVTTTGASNTSMGKHSMYANTTGANNVAFGNDALSSNTTGTTNTALGTLALAANTTAANNTAVGYESLRVSTTAFNNVAIGSQALRSCTSGKENVSIGYQSCYNGVSLTGGQRNVVIGSYTKTSGVGSDNQNVIGYDVTGSGNNTFTFGNATSDTTCTNGATSWSAPSDERLKKDIATSTAGLSFINDLRPVTYKWKNEGDIPSDLSGYVEGSTEPWKNAFTEHGFIAQEVKTVIDAHSELKDGFDMWKEDEKDGRQRIGEGSLVPMLVKAIQELSTKNDALEARITALEA